VVLEPGHRQADDAGRRRRRRILAKHAILGDYTLEVGTARTARSRPAVLRERDEPGAIDGPAEHAVSQGRINDHVVQRAETVNPSGDGTKAAAWYGLTVPAGGSAEDQIEDSIGRAHRARRREGARRHGFDVKLTDMLGKPFDALMSQRQARQTSLRGLKTSWRAPTRNSWS
jgi:hypothetical protein